MRCRPFLLLSVLGVLMLPVACKRQDATPLRETYDESAGADARRIEADLRFLADDLLEGREAGTRGHELAALYVAQRFRAIGLHPAGENGGYYQTVPLLRATRLPDGNTLTVRRADATTALHVRDQFLPALNFNEADAHVEAPAVFVAQAVHAPELDHDDFAGLDLRGKIAVLFYGAPASFDADRRAFYSSLREKLAAVAARGAVGAVFVSTDADEAARPWHRWAEDWRQSGMRLLAPDGTGVDTFPQLRVVAYVSAASADILLAGDGRSAAQLFQAGREGRLRGFALPGTIELGARTAIERTRSRNVVARLPGGDEKLRAEHIVYSAHLDHLGVGAPVDGDAIYNGAIDNALGVSVMLESARQLAIQPVRPKRSMLFVAVTAEEKGLLGAEWFALHPTVPRASLVANLNLDMPVLLAPSRDLVPVGVEHSTLEAVLQRAAKDVGMDLSPDPRPEEQAFVRSDQYAFIRAGVPSVYLRSGVQGRGFGDDPVEAAREFMRTHYHEPGDDATQPIQYADAARLARLNARIGELIADDPQRPLWNAGDFFGQRFATPQRGAEASR